jgi:HK97 family phage major capsid protein
MAPNKNEKRALSNNSPSTNPTSGGGVLVPTSMDDLINYAVIGSGEVANSVQTIFTDTGEGRRLVDADATAQFMQIAVPGTPITLADTPLDARTVYTDFLAAAVTIDDDILQDSHFDISNFVETTIGQIYAQTLAKAIMQGNGSNYDSLTAAAVSAATTTGTTISYDNIVDVYAALPPAAENGAEWLVNKSVWSQLLKLVDGEGRPLLQTTSVVPGGGGPRFQALFGLPVTLSTYSDPLTAGKKPLILTNVRKAYQLRRVGQGLSIQRLNEIGALSLQTTFVVTARGGGYQRVLSSAPTAVALTIGS